MVPSQDYTTFNFIPSSVKIGRAILKKKFNDEMQFTETLLGQITGVNKGLVFEPYAHFILANGGEFTIRNLADESVPESFKLDQSETVKVENKDLEKFVLEDDKYYIPTDPRFAVIDSWTRDTMFQMTVSLNHPVKSGAKQFKALKDKGPTRIIFVVPKDMEAEFKLQPLVLANGKPPSGDNPPQGGWNDVAQYVLKL
jgi:hypothetical protein